MKEPYIVSRVPVMQPKDTTGEILETIKYASWEELQQVFVIDTQQRLQGCIDLYQLLRCDATDNAGTLLKPCFAVSKKHSWSMPPMRFGRLLKKFLLQMSREFSV